jgi:hypothetical protein
MQKMKVEWNGVTFNILFIFHFFGKIIKVNQVGFRWAKSANFYLLFVRDFAICDI